jgi:hypothetical protein
MGLVVADIGQSVEWLTYRLGDQWVGVWLPTGAEIVPLFTASSPSVGPISLLRGCWRLLPGIMCPELEADHSSPSAEAKSLWSFTSTPLYAFTSRDSFSCHAIPSVAASVRLMDFLSAWSWILEKLVVTHILKKFPALYDSQNYITMFTITRR